MSTFLSRSGLLLCGAILLACGEDKRPEQPSPFQPGQPQDGDAAVTPGSDAGLVGDAGTVAPDNQIASSTRSNLQWKRYAAFEADLAQALALPAKELCVELGKENCVRGVHLTPLGGHDPFASGLLESSAEPLATTPTVVERVVLSACNQRVARDRKQKAADAVFSMLDFAPGAKLSDAAIRDAITALYRRLLARDADAHELELVAQLAKDEQGNLVPASEFALSACVAIGTSSEFLFF